MPLAVLPEKWKFPPWSSRTTWFLPAPSLALQSTQKLASLSLLWIPYLPNVAGIHFGCLPQKSHCRKQEKDKRKDCLEKRMAQYQQTLSYFGHHLSVQFHMLLKALFLKIRRNSHFPSFSQVCLNLWVYFFLNLSVEFSYMPVFFRYIKNGAFSDLRQLSTATKAGK